MRTIRIGTRESKLAMVQTNMIAESIKKYHDVNIELVPMKTTGDIILDKSLDKIGGKGLFVKELDLALIENRTDMSVHSLKDMPMIIPGNLPVIAYSRREDPRDALVLPKESSVMDFSKPIGCSSKRRVLQLQKIFPYAEFKSIRGNVITRIGKLDSGEFGAIILAAAGLKRLGLESRISRYFTTEEIIPSAGQGILAIQSREDFHYEYVKEIDDRDAGYAAIGERSFVRTLDGGCSSPIAAYAEIKKDKIFLNGLYYDDASGTYLTGSIYGSPEEAEALGIELAFELKSKGIKA